MSQYPTTYLIYLIECLIEYLITYFHYQFWLNDDYVVIVFVTYFMYIESF